MSLGHIARPHLLLQRCFQFYSVEIASQSNSHVVEESSGFYVYALRKDQWDRVWPHCLVH